MMSQNSSGTPGLRGTTILCLKKGNDVVIATALLQGDTISADSFLASLAEKPLPLHVMLVTDLMFIYRLFWTKIKAQNHMVNMVECQFLFHCC